MVLHLYSKNENLRIPEEMNYSELKDNEKYANEKLVENESSPFNMVVINTNNIFINDYKFSYESCRVCLLVIKKNLGTEFTDLNTKEIPCHKLFLICPELDLRIHSKVSLCVKCFELVNNVYQFSHKCSKSKEHFYEHTFTLPITNKQNWHLLQSYCFVGKSEVKIEEIDLPDTESSLDVKRLQSRINDSKFNIVNKYISNSDLCIDSDYNYSNTQWKNYTVLHKEELKLLPYDYKCTSKPASIKNTFIQSVKKKNKSSKNNPSNALTTDLIQPIHIHTTKRIFKCSQCDYNSLRKDNLATHLRIHSGEKPFKCFSCDYSTVEKSHLKRHLHIHTKEKPLKCSYCGYRCIQRISLKLHLFKHTGEKPLQCPHCDYNTAIKSHLKRHVHVHASEKPFKCFYCNYSSTRKSALRSHLCIHTGEKPYKCPHCDYVSTSRDNLKKHLSRHTGEKSFKCPHCNYSSFQKSSLRSHLYIHGGEKPYKCTSCNYTCVQRSNLKDHLHTHTGEKPFKCSRCNYSCIQKCRLKYHMNNHCIK